MMCRVVSWLFIAVNIFNGLTRTASATTTPLSQLRSRDNKPSITQILVFSSSSETVIPFESNDGWLLHEEKKLRLYISGLNLENSSIVFSSSPKECSADDLVSPIYP